MDSSTQAVSPLRQRMLDDMRMRKLNPKTQSQYIRAVKQFAAFLRQSPTQLPMKICGATSCIWSITVSHRFQSTQRSLA